MILVRDPKTGRLSATDRNHVVVAIWQPESETYHEFVQRAKASLGEEDAA